VLTVHCLKKCASFWNRKLQKQIIIYFRDTTCTCTVPVLTRLCTVLRASIFAFYFYNLREFRFVQRPKGHHSILCIWCGWNFSPTKFFLFPCCPTLKGNCHEIFDPRFFSSNNLSYRALIHGLKLFLTWLRVRRENRFENCQNLIPRCQWHRWIRLFCQSSPLIFTFSSKYMYVMITYCMYRYFILLWFPFKGNGSH
jgi:hypothetical protein